MYCKNVASVLMVSEVLLLEFAIMNHVIAKHVVAIIPRKKTILEKLMNLPAVFQ